MPHLPGELYRDRLAFNGASDGWVVRKLLISGVDGLDALHGDREAFADSSSTINATLGMMKPNL